MPNAPVLAAATGLPAETHNPSRRLFLAAGSAAAVFASLSAVAKEGPSRAAVALTDDERRLLLQNYQTWLNMELSYLEHELGTKGAFRVNNAGWDYHWRAYGTTPAPAPSTRAEAVLAAVGCDWRHRRGGANV
jgi:hypothetical protein